MEKNMNSETSGRQRVRKINPQRIQRTSGRAILITLFTITIGFMILWQASSSYEKRLVKDLQSQVGVQLVTKTSTLATVINRRFALLRGLKAFVESDPSPERLEAAFQTFASGLYSSTAGIRNLSIAPGGVQQYVYPLESNEGVLGHDLLHDERSNVRADVQRAIETKQIAISGPYELRQGGQGLVARQAIFKNDTFWGLIAMVLDTAPILEEAGLDAGPTNLVFALRDGTGQVFWGQESVFQQEPIINQVELPEGVWDLAVVPQDGWYIPIREPLLIFKGSGLIILIILSAFVFHIANRHAFLKLMVEQRTKELAEELEERKRIEIALREYSEKIEELVKERTRELENTQAELVRQEKMALIGKLAGGVGHELRNPLGVITNAVYYLKNLREADVAVQEYLDIISTEVQYAIQFISKLLEFADIGPAQKQFQEITFLIQATIDRCPPPQTVVIKDLTSSDLPPVFIDPNQIISVFSHLVENAYQAMPNGGVLTIDCDVNDGFLLVSLQDTGCGVAAEYQERIFDPLFTTKSRGIGLGLVLVKKLIGMNGGDIQYKSVEGKGATFIVKLPLVEKIIDG